MKITYEKKKQTLFEFKDLAVGDICETSYDKYRLGRDCLYLKISKNSYFNLNEKKYTEISNGHNLDMFGNFIWTGLTKLNAKLIIKEKSNEN